MMNQMSSNVGPMSRVTRGIPAGVSMENGMGMLTGEPGVPTGEDYGPSLGRGMGFGSTRDFPKSNGAISQQNAEQHGQEMSMGQMQGEVAPNADAVPGFPQDAYMEGSMMAMDEMVAKPQTYGLPRGWSGFMQVMMKTVRVLPTDKYEEVMELIRRGENPRTNPHEMPNMQHPK
jgi:hypothetical protein